MTPEQQSIHLAGELARLQREVARLERELEQERQLADGLAGWAQQLLDGYMGQVPHDDCACGDCQILPVLDKDLADWRKSRNE